MQYQLRAYFLGICTVLTVFERAFQKISEIACGTFSNVMS